MCEWMLAERDTTGSGLCYGFKAPQEGEETVQPVTKC
jgi:hypothetical protein